MLEYNCYIVDDEADSIEILRDYVHQTPDLRLIHSTTNPRDIFSVISQHNNPKITFLDIEMPGITGLELAGLIDSHTAVIFITSYSDYAVEAFEKDAYDFLVKPVSYSRFLQAVIKVQKRMRNTPATSPADDSYFFIRGTKQGQFLKIYFHEILYIESLQNYIKLYTTRGIHITYLTLKEVEFKLNRTNFLKIHKSYVVNFDRIGGLINNELSLDNNAVIPVGAVYRQDLLVRLKNKILTTDRRKETNN
ncbi:MAG: LytR/AlgR family response regulator transcription factor [Daejeonella sp.]